jgi:hypothetical protein
MVLHTDQPHPHVHLVVKAISEQGKRLNIRKETLREWRREFARHLRAQGIAANATERVVRGITRPQKSDGIYRAMRAGRSTHMRQRAASVVADPRAGSIHIEPGRAQLAETRESVVEGWLGLSQALRASGRDGLAHEVDRFTTGMPPPKTEREWIAQALVRQARHADPGDRRPISR